MMPHPYINIPQNNDALIHNRLLDIMLQLDIIDQRQYNYLTQHHIIILK